MAVEGFTHTRNQKRYMFQLLVGFWIMNLGSPIVQHFFEVGNLALSNNIFTDLYIAVLAMYGIQEISVGRRTHHSKQILLGGLAIIAPILLSLLALGLIVNPKTMMFAANLAMVIPTIMLAENGLLLYIGVFFIFSETTGSYNVLPFLFSHSLTLESTPDLPSLDSSLAIRNG